MRAKSRNTFTTGEISKICDVAQRTAIKWFDKGLIDGYIIPGTKDRRIPFNSLIEFMKKNNLPFDLFYQVEKSNLIEYCWEYNAKKMGSNSHCRECMIYDTKSLKCYRFLKCFSSLQKSSDAKCQECDYYSKYWKEENLTNETSPYCWEFFSGPGDTNRDCKSCIIYKTRCHKCFEFIANIPTAKNICGAECKDCNFFYILEKYLNLDKILNPEKQLV